MPTSGEIYYFESGGGVADKPPVVLIHGAGGNYLHWPYNLRRIPGYRIFAPDLPGHGKSGGLGQQSIAAYAQGLVKWLDAVEIRRAVFVGHSMGGAIAQTLALEHPKRTVGLGLVGTGARLKVNPDLLKKLSSPGTVNAALDLIVNWCYAKETPQKHVRQVRKQLGETRPSVVYGDYLACDRFDVREKMKHILVPTLVLCGEEDRMTPPSYSEYLAEEIPHGQLTLIPKAGHMVMLERAEAVAKALEDFLGTIRYSVS